MDKRRVHDPDDVYDFIIAYKRRNDGNSPTIREIMDNCEISSTAVVSGILRRLELLGRIKLRDGPRGIVVCGGRWLGPDEKIYREVKLPRPAMVQA